MKKYSFLLLALSVSACLFGLPQNVRASVQEDSLKVAPYIAYYQEHRYAVTDSTIARLQEGLARFEKEKSNYALTECFYMLGASYMIKANSELARKNLKAALALALKSGNKRQLANIYSSLGVTEGKSSNYEGAIRYLLLALKLFEESKNDKGIISTYLKLGAANELGGNLDRALSYYNKALSIPEKDSLSGNSVNLLNNIGSLYCRKGAFSTAIPYFKKALSRANSPNLVQARLSPLNNLGSAYLNIMQFDTGLYYLNQARAVAHEQQMPEEEARAILNIASAYDHSDPQQAIRLMDTAYNIVLPIGNRLLQAEILEGMMQVTKGIGNFKEAFELQSQLVALRDSIFNINREKEIQNLQATYDFEKSEAHIAALQLEAKKDQAQKQFAGIIAGVLALLLLTLVFFYRRRAKLMKRISQHEAELELANKVKDRLFSIIGHDLQGHVANVPMLVDMYMNEGTEDEKNFLMSSLKENSVAITTTLDNLLAWGRLQIKGAQISKTQFSAKEKLNINLTLFRQTLAYKNIVMDIDIPDDLYVEADMHQYKFIIRNLMSNAIKYSNRGGTIHIKAYAAKDGHTFFEVRDNGIGMDEVTKQSVFNPFMPSAAGTANEGGNGLGLMLCKEFVQQNGGKIWFLSEEGVGTTFTFTLKTAVILEPVLA